MLKAELDEHPDEQLQKRHEVTKGGDKRALRGIPVHARGVGGVSAGTDPAGAVEAKERAPLPVKRWPRNCRAGLK